MKAVAIVPLDPVKESFKVTVVGPSFLFYGGLSVYTQRLSAELAQEHDVSVLLLRELVPRRLYPGRRRVGAIRSESGYADLPTYDGIDWFWIPSLVGAIRWLLRHRPAVLVLQWWTAATLHTYLALTLVARLVGCRCVLEFHEVQDPGESEHRWVRWYAHLGIRILARCCSGALIHSAHDRELLEEVIDFERLSVRQAPHGPYDHLSSANREGAALTARPDDDLADPDDGEVTNLLFFGLIRPYKGLEDLIDAFDQLDPKIARKFKLTVVGETWENWHLPAEKIAESRHKDRICFVNRYVEEKEVLGFFEESHALILPYRRASSSGPLQIAMSQGMCVVVYDVPGLKEVTGSYEGTIPVPPNDVNKLAEALVAVPTMRPGGYRSSTSWTRTREAYSELFDSMGVSESL